MSELANLLNSAYLYLLLILVEVVSVLTNDGKRVVGTLKGFDQVTNLILENSHERIYCKDKGVEVVPMGLFIIRGDNLYALSYLSCIELLLVNWICE